MVFSKISATTTTVNPGTFLSPPKDTLYPLVVTSHLSSELP